MDKDVEARVARVAEKVSEADRQIRLARGKINGLFASGLLGDDTSTAEVLIGVDAELHTVREALGDVLTRLGEQ